MFKNHGHGYASSWHHKTRYTKKTTLAILPFEFFYQSRESVDIQTCNVQGHTPHTAGLRQIHSLFHHAICHVKRERQEYYHIKVSASLMLMNHHAIYAKKQEGHTFHTDQKPQLYYIRTVLEYTYLCELLIPSGTFTPPT